VLSKPRVISKIGRKRKVSGWTLLVLGVIVAGVWLASGLWRVSYLGKGFYVQLRNGQLVTGRNDDPRFFKGWSALMSDPSERGLEFWFGWRKFAVSTTGSYSYGVVHIRDVRITGRVYEYVLWPVPLPLLMTGGVLLWWSGAARRRALRGKCGVCGYDLGGLEAGGKCPECGWDGR
jgi:hypothetical protein